MFGDQLVQNPDSVLDSNMLISAIDMREDYSGTKFEDKGVLWRWWNHNLRDDGCWFRFEIIPGLDDCAPLARTYRASNGICLSDYITLFSRILTNQIVDFEELRRFINGAGPVEYIRRMRSIAPSVPDVSEMEEDSDSE